MSLKYSLVLRESFVKMDKFKLIAEIRKFQFVWKNIRNYPQAFWIEIAQRVGVDAAKCRSAWVSLRNRYRNENKRTKERIAWLKRTKRFIKNKDYDSKWVYYKHLKFLDNIYPKLRDKKRSRNDDDADDLISNFSNTESINDDSEIEIVIEISDADTKSDMKYILEGSSRPAENDNNSKTIANLYCNEFYEDVPSSNRDDNLHQNAEMELEDCINIKQEPYDIPNSNGDDNLHQNAEMELEDCINIKQQPYDVLNSENFEHFCIKEIPDNKNTGNEIKNISLESFEVKVEPMKSVDCPLIDRSLTTHLDMNNKSTEEAFNDKTPDFDSNFLISFLSHMKSMSQLQNLSFRAEMSTLMLSILSANQIIDKHHVNVLEELKLNTLLKPIFDVGDADCNFLVSFLPHLKSMSRLQNLQFRAKMSLIMLNTFSEFESGNIALDSTTHYK